MKPAGWIGLLGGALLLTGCASFRSAEGVAAEKPQRYPVLFQQETRARLGIGFSSLHRFSPAGSCSLAAETACRALAWSIRVRVQGERLLERTGGGHLEYRGENIALLELPEVTPETCLLETLQVDQRVWVAAVREGLPADSGPALIFPSRPPAWIKEVPREPEWHTAVGAARISYKDEPGSWELAAYQALVELAFSVGSRTRSLEKAADGMLLGATILEVDTLLKGFQVVSRWRDAEHAYVLARVPVGGAISLLGQRSGTSVNSP